MSYYYLEITRGIEIGRRYLINDGAISIGRSSQNNIVFHSAEKNVSSHHMIIYKSPERIMVQDLQSTNGSFVNEIKTSEKDINPDDTIGFGKEGPRLKLIISDVELDTSKRSSELHIDTSLRTKEDKISPFIKNASRSTVQSGSTLSSDRTFEGFNERRKTDQQEDTSITMEIEQRLVGKSIDATDMKMLMKDGKRLERVLEKGTLGQTQTGLLRTMYTANRSMRRTWIYIIFAVAIILTSIASFFAIKTYNYQHILNKAQMLKKDIAAYDRKISSVNSNPEANSEELKRLISELEEKEKSFSSLSTQINEDDFGKFYSDPIEQKIDGILLKFGESDYHIPKEMVERVKHHIDVYTGPLHGTIGRYLKRKDKYFPMIQKIFRENNLPVELAYIAMLESGFNPMALSPVGARGMWQFMPATGKDFGMSVDADNDQRLEPERATVAAAQYFKELIGMFGGKSSVMLCMAAYNAGEGRIMRALRKIENPMKNRDFWYIYRMGYLAEETNEYIPRVIALMIISEHPEHYGFNPAAPADLQNLETASDFVPIPSAKQR